MGSMERRSLCPTADWWRATLGLSGGRHSAHSRHAPATAVLRIDFAYHARVSDARGPVVTDLATAQAVIATLQAELTHAQRENASLRHQLDVLCQRLFGKKSERVDPRQLQRALEQLANEPGPVTEPIEMDSGDTPVREHQRRRPIGRRPLPAHLPRRRVEI